MENTLLPGTIVHENYKIIEPVSSGKFSNVYIAKLTDTENTVIIKELFRENIEAKSEEEAITLFNQEIETYTGLKHENLSVIFESLSTQSAVKSGNKEFIIMEHVKGKTLRTIKEEQGDKLSPEEVGKWMIEICNALMYLGEQNPPLLYYYFSPDHVIITEDGKLKLINFGFGRTFKDGPFKVNKFMGIPGYSAPEQYGGKGIDEKADIFGLGALVYFLLTNQDPEKNPFNFTPVRTLNPLVSLQFARVISKCLQMKPEERFESLKDLKEKLTSITFIDAQVSPDMIKKKEDDQKEQKEKTQKIVGTVVSGWQQELLWTIEKYIPLRQIAPIAIIIVLLAVIGYMGVNYINSGPKSPDTAIYTAQYNGDSIEILDMDQKTVFKKIEVSECKSRFQSFNNNIYIGGASTYLLNIDAKKMDLNKKKCFEIGFSPIDIIITKDGQYIYAINPAKNEVAKIVLAAKTVMANIKAGETAFSMALSDNEHYLYVANYKSNDITIIDTTTNTVSGKIAVTGRKPKKLLTITGKNQIYCSNWESGDITVINTTNNSLGKTIQTGNNPTDMVLSEDKSTVYVANNRSNTISIISTSQEAKTGDINVKEPPYALGFGDRNQLLVSVGDTRKNTGKILVINTTKNEIVSEIPSSKAILSFMAVKK